METDREHYRVELYITPESSEDPRLAFKISLHDRMYPDAAAGDARLDLDQMISEGLTARAFCAEFLAGGGGAEDGLAFGRWLAARLFEDVSLACLWSKSATLRGSRPLRLQVFLPRGQASWVAELPLELLADDEGFLFRRPGHSIIRGISGFEKADAKIPRNSKATVVWANPKCARGPGRLPAILPATIFATHEATLARGAAAAGLDSLPPAGKATKRDWDMHLRRNAPVALVSLIAHGDPEGGRVTFHKEGHPAFPEDPGEPIHASDLAHELRLAQTRVALLWVCHGARSDALAGAVAETFLDPLHGDLAACVASHAALRAAGTPHLSQALFDALANVATGDFEVAMSEARHALSEDDLQWAAPAYYARTLEGSHLTIEQAVKQPREISSAPPRQHVLAGAPALTPHFCGREEDVARGLGALRAGRLVTVLGLPGIGKTEVALAVAGQALQDPTLGLDRADWFTLESMSDVNNLRTRIALSFGLERCESDDTLVAAIGKTCALLVLDNAEDLIRVARLSLQQFLSHVLARCTGMRLLLSSRRRLGDLDGDVAEIEQQVGRIASPFDRVAFIAAAGARLAQAERHSPGLDALVAELDGHPRSLMLVASQIGRGRNLSALLQALHTQDVDSILADELLGEDLAKTPDNLLRSKRLISSINLSYDPLRASSPKAAELFDWLGTLPAGLPSILVSTVFGESGEESMATLLRHNLVAIEGEDRRLSLPAPLRWYAARKLAEWPPQQQPRERALLEATAAAVGSWLAATHSQLGTVRSQEAVARAVREHANLEALLKRHAETASDSAALCNTAVCWAPIMTYGGRSRTAVPLLETLVANISSLTANLGDANALFGEARALQALGNLYVRTERLKEAGAAYDRALPVYERALPVYQSIDDKLGEANTLQALGDLYVRAERLKEAEAAYERALQAYGRIDDKVEEARTLQALGELYLRTGRLKEAEAVCERALTVYEWIGTKLGAANTLQTLGALYVRAGRLKEAEAVYGRALPVYEHIDDKLGEANTLQVLGDLYVQTDRLIEAEATYARAMPLYERIDDKLGQATMLQVLGDLYVRTDRFEEATTSYERALTVYGRIGAKLGEANTLQGLGTLALARKNLGAGFDRFLGSLAIHRVINDRLGQGADHGYLARAALEAGQIQRALVLSGAAIQIFSEIDDRQGRLIALLDARSAFLHAGEVVAAYSCLLLAWTLACSIQDPSTDELAEALGQLFGGRPPAEVVTEEMSLQAQEDVEAAFERYRKLLAERGEDPYFPLSYTEPEGNIS